jgi:hypothetical protein
VYEVGFGRLYLLLEWAIDLKFGMWSWFNIAFKLWENIMLRNPVFIDYSAVTEVHSP